MNKPLEPESPNAHPKLEELESSLAEIVPDDDSVEETVIEEQPKVSLPHNIPAEHSSDSTPPTRKYFSDEG